VRRRYALPFIALALPACSGPTINAHQAGDLFPTSTAATAQPTTSAPEVDSLGANDTSGADPTSTTSTSTTPSTTTTVTTVMHAEPEPVASPQRAADGPGSATVSWYGDESGSHTANGERYNPDGFTFAHKTMAFGTLVEFCRAGRCVVARCTDRGPFVDGRTFDLSRAAFASIAPLGAGVASVTWSRV
jgi:rare lipoprotein A